MLRVILKFTNFNIIIFYNLVFVKKYIPIV